MKARLIVYGNRDEKKVRKERDDKNQISHGDMDDSKINDRRRLNKGVFYA